MQHTAWVISEGLGPHDVYRFRSASVRAAGYDIVQQPEIMVALVKLVEEGNGILLPAERRRLFKVFSVKSAFDPEERVEQVIAAALVIDAIPRANIICGSALRAAPSRLPGQITQNTRPLPNGRTLQTPRDQFKLVPYSCLIAGNIGRCETLLDSWEVGKIAERRSTSDTGQER